MAMLFADLSVGDLKTIQNRSCRGCYLHGRERNQDIQDNFDPTVVKMRRKRKIILTATALDDLIRIGGDDDQSN